MTTHGYTCNVFLMNAPTYTTTALGTVVLGRTTYTAELVTYDSGRSDTFLTGPRGARYLLRDFLYRGRQVDTGVRQVISLGSGQPLRVRGNEVRVVQVGDVIEVAA